MKAALLKFSHLTRLSVNYTPYSGFTFNYGGVYTGLGRKLNTCDAIVYSSYETLAYVMNFRKSGIANAIKPLNGQNLYIDQECKIPRDIIRKSGYNIVRDPNKAVTVIVPTVREYLTYTYNAVIYNEAASEIYCLDLNNLTQSDITDDIYYALEDAIKKRFPTTKIYMERGKNVQLSFVRTCESYRNFFNGSYPSRSYLEEDLLQVIPSTEITPEVLSLWARLENQGMLERLILGSDWRKYPLTVRTLLRAYHSDITASSDKFRDLLIELQCDYASRYNSYDPVVTPEDWNMLQNWIFYMLNVDADRGYVNKDQYGNLPIPFQQYLRKAVCVSKFNINQPMLCSNLLSAVESV